jgi:polyphosphate:AMP phosphotransferase
VIILIAGVDGAGKGETVNLLNEWMDPRHIRTRALSTMTDEERERPPLWRFWRALPPKGKIGIFFGSWYTDPIVQRVLGNTKPTEHERSLHQIARFERMLIDEGALLLKFWFHLSKKQQKERLNTLEKNPKTRWRVTRLDWSNFKLYDEFRKVSERTLRETSLADAPWTVIEGVDPRYRSLTTATVLLQKLRARLDAPAAPAAPAPAATSMSPHIDDLHVVKTLDLSQAIPKKKYERQLEKYERKLNLLLRNDDMRDRSVVAVFEGSDAAGKGGAIRRVTAALDARQYHVIPIAAPTEEERAQPYLWRFWRNLPRKGHLAIFDRSWYGRVLVERVEGFCRPNDWMRAYPEINDFEEQLVNAGTVVVKFWLQISKDEQLRRFKEREATRFKRFKITADDWRNREKWDAYEHAVADMVDNTSTEIAPWTLVAANDKYFARIKVLKTLCNRIEAALARKR